MVYLLFYIFQVYLHEHDQDYKRQQYWVATGRHEVPNTGTIRFMCFTHGTITKSK